MANDVEIRITGDDSDAQRALDRTKRSLKDVSKTVRNVGLGMAAFGAAAVLAGKSFITAALEQERATATLGAIVNATGVSFDELRPKIEATTAALQRKTNFGDEEQLRALTKMIPILGSVEKAMLALPAVMDGATTSGSSLETVAVTLSRALSGAADVAESVGVDFEKTDDFATRLEKTLAKVGGAAEANVDPMAQMGNSIGDLKEAIGRGLLPVVIPLADKVGHVTETFIRFADAHPTLIRNVGIAAVGIGVLGVALVGLGVVLPALVTGFAAVGVAITLATGPIGLAILAVSGLVAAFFIFRDKIPAVLKTVGDAISFFINNVVLLEFSLLIDALNLIGKVAGFEIPKLVVNLGSTFEAVGQKIEQSGDKVATSIQGIIPSMENVTVATRDAAMATDLFKDSLNRVKTSVEKVETAVENLGTTFGGIPLVKTRHLLFDLSTLAGRTAKAFHDLKESAESRLEGGFVATLRQDIDNLLSRLDVATTRLTDEVWQHPDTVAHLKEVPETAEALRRQTPLYQALQRFGAGENYAVGTRSEEDAMNLLGRFQGQLWAFAKDPRTYVVVNLNGEQVGGIMSQDVSSRTRMAN